MEQASVAMEPAGAPKALTFALAVVMSIFLAVMLAFVYEYTDQTFKSPEDVERGLGIPFLGGVRKNADPGEYQNVSEQIYLLMKDKRLQTLLMTSSRTGEGVTTVTHSIGKYIAANLGHKVLIIDANPRHLSGKKRTKPRRAGALRSPGRQGRILKDGQRRREQIVPPAGGEYRAQPRHPAGDPQDGRGPQRGQGEIRADPHRR